MNGLRLGSVLEKCMRNKQERQQGRRRMSAWLYQIRGLRTAPMELDDLVQHFDGESVTPFDSTWVELVSRSG